MNTLTVITNNVPRDIIDAWELTAAEREQFDYIDWDAIERGEDSASFVRYKDELYDLGDLERPAAGIFPGWDAYLSDTFFSGILLRYVEDDGDWRIVMGRYYS